VQESLPLILMQVLVGLKKSNFLRGKTLYPEISDVENTVIHMCGMCLLSVLLGDWEAVSVSNSCNYKKIEW